MGHGCDCGRWDLQQNWRDKRVPAIKGKKKEKRRGKGERLIKKDSKKPWKDCKGLASEGGFFFVFFPWKFYRKVLFGRPLLKEKDVIFIGLWPMKGRMKIFWVKEGGFGHNLITLRGLERWWSGAYFLKSTNSFFNPDSLRWAESIAQTEPTSFMIGVVSELYHYVTVKESGFISFK